LAGLINCVGFAHDRPEDFRLPSCGFGFMLPVEDLKTFVGCHHQSDLEKKIDVKCYMERFVQDVDDHPELDKQLCNAVEGTLVSLAKIVFGERNGNLYMKVGEGKLDLPEEFALHGKKKMWGYYEQQENVPVPIGWYSIFIEQDTMNFGQVVFEYYKY